MSATLKIPPQDTDAQRSLYERDFYAWTAEQARLIRSGSIAEIDLHNLAEEIESLGISEKRELRSRVHTIVEHLLKLEFSTSSGPVEGWMETVHRTRTEIEFLLADSPSLAGTTQQIVAQVQDSAAQAAARSLRMHGEDASGIAARMRAGGLSRDEVFGNWLPERHGRLGNG